MSERDDWLDWRREGITATDIARTVTGYYGSAYAVVDEKINPEEADEPTSAMQRGLDAEIPIARAVEALTGLYVVNAQLRACHPDRPEFRCTLDGELAEAPDAAPIAVGEWKTVGPHVNAPIDYYVAQVNWQLYIRGLSIGLIAQGSFDEAPDGSEALVGLRLKRVEADPELQAHLIEVADRLLGYIKERRLPPADGSSFTSELIKQRYAIVDPDAEAVDISSLDDLLDERFTLAERLTDLETRKNEIENRVKALIGESSRGTSGRWKCSWSQRKTLDVSLVNAAHPDLVAKHTKPPKPDIDLAALAADLGKKTADQFRVIPIGRVLRITPIKEIE